MVQDVPNHKADSSSHEAPVMCCHPAAREVTTRLVRGSAPSTPIFDGTNAARMSIKKFFRVTPEEDAQIAKNAASCGLQISSYLRLQALGKAKVRKNKKVRAEWDELRRCLGVVNRAGNVVNQMVVVLRTGGSDADLPKRALADLTEAARAIANALRHS